MSDTAFTAKARLLRESFDHSFTLPARDDNREMESLLMLRINTETHAVKTAEIAGLFADKKIVPVPSAQSAFLGLIGVKGTLVPVWNLSELLGYGSAQTHFRWVVIGAGATPWALAFDGFEGCLNVFRADLCPAAGEGQRSKYAPETCRMADGVRPVLSLPFLRETIQSYFQPIEQRRQTS